LFVNSEGRTHFGTPQTRREIFVLGARDGLRVFCLN